MAEEPVEIELRLNQNVDTEGEKAVEGLEEVARAAFEQKKIITQLTSEISTLKKIESKMVKTQDPQLIADKEKLIETIGKLEKKLVSAQSEYVNFQNKLNSMSTSSAVTTQNLSKSTNQLSYSVQQVARELPNLAISPQLFIMAISNNLPILQDQLRKTRIENELLKKSGQTTTPVWKQVTASIFSWQTALIGAITMLTVFGKDIFSAVGSLFNFNHAVKLSKEEIKNLKDELAKGLGSELGKMNQLFDNLKNAPKGTQEYYNTKREIIKQFGGYLQGLDAETVALENQAKAYETIRKELIKTAKEKALSNIYSEQSEKFSNTYLEQMPKIRKLLVDEYGAAMGDTYADLIDKQLQEGKGFSYAIQRVIKDMEKTGSTTFASNTGAAQTITFQYNSLQEAIDKVTDSAATMQAKINHARKSLNMVLKGSLDGEPIKQDKSFWEDQKNTALEALEAMTEAAKGTKEWNDQLALYNEAVTKLKTWDFSDKSKENEREENKLEKAKYDLAKMSAEMQQEIDAATVAAMQEGAAKKLRAIEAEYDKRKMTVALKLAEIEKLEKITGAPATGQRNLLYKSLQAYTTQYKAEKDMIEADAQKEINAVFADVNERFNTRLQNQLNKIDLYYEEHLIKLKENVIARDELDRLSVELADKRNKERAIAVEEYNLETLKWQEQIAMRRQEIANEDLRWETDKQKKLLEIQIDYAHRRMMALNAIKLSGGDAEEEIERLREEIERLKKLLGKTDGDKLKEIAETLGRSLQKVASSLHSMPGDLGEIGSLLGGIADGASDIESMLDGTASATDLITASVNAMSRLFEMVAGQIIKNKELQADWNEKIKEAAHQAALASIELQAYQAGNLFGIENPYAKAIAGAKQYAAAISELQQNVLDLEKGQVQVGTKKVFSWKNALKGLITSPAGGILGAFTRETKTVFESLAKKYGEIYNKETFELNPQILQDYAKLDSATKKLVDNWEEIRKKALEAEQQMRDTFRDLAGDIGTQLSDALVLAFRNNDLTNAMNQFEDGVGRMIENIIAQMVFATFFEDMLKDLEEGMMGSFKEGGDSSIIDDILKFTEQYAASIPGFMEAMKVWQDEMRKQGIDLFAPDNTTRTASPKGIAQASQDSVDELNGRITNIQQMMYDIRSSGSASLSVNNELLNYQRMIRSQLDTVVENSNHLPRLEKIENSLSDISLKGIKIRQ